MYRDSIIVSKLPEVLPKMKMEYDDNSFLQNAGNIGADNQLLLLFSWFFLLRIDKFSMNFSNNIFNVF